MNLLLALDDSPCAAAGLRAVINQCRPHDTTVRVLHVIEWPRKDPREEILAMAEAWPADDIVIGSHGRKGLDRMLLGSVSHGVVRQAACSVLIVRESGADRRVEDVRADGTKVFDVAS